MWGRSVKGWERDAFKFITVLNGNNKRQINKTKQNNTHESKKTIKIYFKTDGICSIMIKLILNFFYNNLAIRFI